MLTTNSWADTLDETFLETHLDNPNQVTVWLRCPKQQLERFDGDGDGNLDADELRQEGILEAIGTNFVVTGDTWKGRLELLPSRLDAPDLTHINFGTRWHFIEPPSRFRIYFDWLVESEDNPRCLASFEGLGKGRARAFVFDAQNKAFDFRPQQSTLGRFLMVGLQHILEGYHHLLFLLVLLLAAGGSTWDIFKMVTAFTLAHSLTLALAVLGIINLPAWFIEPVILISILVAAVENLRNPDPENRWKLTAGFGLIHGMGFAGALTDLNLRGSAALKPLLGFNLGLEVGLVMLVLLVAPVLAWMNHQPWARRAVVSGSVGAAAVALMWLSQYFLT